jgi:enolase
MCHRYHLMLRTEQLDVLTCERKVTPRAVFEEIAQRYWTSALLVSDDIFATAIERLRQWVDEHYGQPSTMNIQKKSV